MPLKNGTPHCINHPDIPLTSDPGQLNALPAASQNEDAPSVNLSEMVLITVYACTTCGYIELYWAKKKALEYQKKETAKEAAAAAAIHAAAETPKPTSTTPKAP